MSRPRSLKSISSPALEWGVEDWLEMITPWAFTSRGMKSRKKALKKACMEIEFCSNLQQFKEMGCALQPKWV
jgi:hypothetical protein